MRTVYDLLDDYLLTHELADITANFYKRMVSVLCSWAKRRVPLDCFTTDLVNRMLLDKQRAGLSSYYRKTLRSAMRALLAHQNGGSLPGKLRSVKLEPLRPASWTAQEVQRLIDACVYMRDKERRNWWQSLIAVAYYTGLATADLWKLKPADIDRATGIVRVERSKTGKPVAMRVPAAWLARLPRSGELIWGRPMSVEVFRCTFRRVVRKAGLVGTFKQLRKSCGTSVEMREPGRGHIALGNTRKVFEQHYLSRRHFDAHPPRPDSLPGESDQPPEPPRAA